MVLLCASLQITVFMRAYLLSNIPWYLQRAVITSSSVFRLNSAHGYLLFHCRSISHAIEWFICRTRVAGCGRGRDEWVDWGVLPIDSGYT